VKSGNNAFRYWKLVENYSTGRGTRQRVVAHLGRLENFGAEDWRKLAERMGQPDMAAALEYRVGNVRPGRPSDRIAPLLPEEADQAVAIRLADVGWKDPRRFGDVYVALHFWRKLGLGDLLAKHLKGRSATMTCQVAALMVANRLVAPESELGMLDWWPRTALPELLGLPVERIDANRLYRCLDAVLPHKARIEEHLAQVGRDLFGREYTTLLYDLTSTYFEGQAVDVPMAKRGYSRDKRPDAKQICIGVVVDWEGFPVGYELYDGNVRDHQTVSGTLKKLDERYPEIQPTVCMDRGMVTDETMALLRKRYRYIVAERRETMAQYLPQITETSWQVVRQDCHGVPLIEVQELKVEGSDRLILVRSAGCAKKEHGIHERMVSRLTGDLDALKARVAEGRLKQPDKIERAIGRILERYPGTARWVQVKREEADDPEGTPCSVSWQLHSDLADQRETMEGLYLLRTNVHESDPAQLWNGYMTLTQVESVFRHLKQELRLRPVFHYKERRVEAHILLSYLAYVLLWVIERTHRQRGGGLTGRRVLEVLSGIEMGTILLRTAEGRRLEIERLSTPRPEEQETLNTLDVRLPDRRARDKLGSWQMQLIDYGDKNDPAKTDFEIK
jgi:transposase